MGATLTGRNPYQIAGKELTGQGADERMENRYPGQYFCGEARDQLLSRRLQKQGYTTALIGKYHFVHQLSCYDSKGEFVESFPTAHEPYKMGWDHFYGFFHGVAQSLWDHRDWVGTAGESIADDHRDEHQTDYTARKVVQVIETLDPSKDKLFMWVSFTAPHTQNDT